VRLFLVYRRLYCGYIKDALRVVRCFRLELGQCLIKHRTVRLDKATRIVTETGSESISERGRSKIVHSFGSEHSSKNRPFEMQVYTVYLYIYLYIYINNRMRLSRMKGERVVTHLPREIDCYGFRYQLTTLLPAVVHEISRSRFIRDPAKTGDGKTRCIVYACKRRAFSIISCTEGRECESSRSI